MDEVSRSRVSYTVTILSTADWDAPLWTNKQQIASRLAQRGHKVVYVNSLGLRQPSVSSADLGRVWRVVERGLGKLLARLRFREITLRSVGQADNGRKSPTVLSLPVVPFHRFRIARTVNVALLKMAARNISGDVLWTFSPVTYGLERSHSALVYHSVDILQNLPRVPKQFVQRSEDAIVAVADEIVTSSQEIAKSIGLRHDREVLVWENVGDVSLFRASMLKSRKSTVVFCGNLTPTKVDFDLLLSLASAGIHLTIAGPTSIDGERARVSIQTLLAHPNVSYVGTLTQNDLAVLCGSASIGLIPYKINDYTRGVFPLKVFEYLAAGLPVVSTRLPSLRGRSIYGLETADRGSFVDRVLTLTSTTIPTNFREAVSDAVSNNSWDARTDEVEILLDTIMDGKSARCEA